MDDARPGSQYFDSIAKLAARLDAELERYANVGLEQEADFATIGSGSTSFEPATAATASGYDWL